MTTSANRSSRPSSQKCWSAGLRGPPKRPRRDRSTRPPRSGDESLSLPPPACHRTGRARSAHHPGKPERDDGEGDEDGEADHVGPHEGHDAAKHQRWITPVSPIITAMKYTNGP